MFLHFSAFWTKNLRNFIKYVPEDVWYFYTLSSDFYIEDNEVHIPASVWLLQHDWEKIKNNIPEIEYDYDESGIITGDLIMFLLYGQTTSSTYIYINKLIELYEEYKKNWFSVEITIADYTPRLKPFLEDNFGPEGGTWFMDIEPTPSYFSSIGSTPFIRFLDEYQYITFKLFV